MDCFVPSLGLAEFAEAARIGREAQQRYMEVVQMIKDGEQPDVEHLGNCWLHSSPYQFEVPTHLSIASLNFVTFLKAIENQSPDSLANIDGAALLKAGIMDMDYRDPFKYSISRVMGTLDLVCDRWDRAIGIRGMKQFLSALLHRLAKCACSLQTPDVFDDGRYCEELPGIKKRIEEEDKHWASVKQREKMKLLSEADLQKMEELKKQLFDWRPERQLQPKMTLFSNSEVIFRGLFAELELYNARNTALCTRSTEDVIIRMCMHSILGGYRKTMQADRNHFYFMSQIPPGDLERYHRQCPQLPIAGKAILSVFRSNRIITPSTPIDELMRDTSDQCSALALCRRVFGEIISITQMSVPFDDPDHVSLRFVGHRLACVTNSKAYFAKEDRTPYSVIGFFLQECDHPIDMNYQEEEIAKDEFEGDAVALIP